MSPENQWLEDVFPIEIVPFRGDVSFQGCIICWGVDGKIQCVLELERLIGVRYFWPPLEASQPKGQKKRKTVSQVEELTP